MVKCIEPETQFDSKAPEDPSTIFFFNRRSETCNLLQRRKIQKRTLEQISTWFNFQSYMYGTIEIWDVRTYEQRYYTLAARTCDAIKDKLGHGKTLLEQDKADFVQCGEEISFYDIISNGNVFRNFTTPRWLFPLPMTL
jgi:hypothetical protein